MVTKSTHVINDNMEFWKIGDVNPFVEAIEHEKHAVHSFYSRISDALRSIWHHTKDKRAKS